MEHLWGGFERGRRRTETSRGWMEQGQKRSDLLEERICAHDYQDLEMRPYNSNSQQSPVVSEHL